MNVLVTGANGFVGGHIVQYLSALNYQIRAAARTEIKQPNERVTWIRAPDLTSDADWTAAVAGIDAVVHCAARVHIMNDMAADPVSEFRRVNCEGTMALARAAVAAGVERFIFMSSIKVNGECTTARQPFRASDEPRPQDAYGLSKLEAEQKLFSLSRETDLEVVVIRPTLV